MDRPTLTDLHLWSRVDFSGLDDPFEDDVLQVLLDRAIDYVTQVTGRAIDDTMPLPLTTIAQEAIQMRVEQVAYQSQTDYTETGADDQIESFTAGGYTESRGGGRTRYTGLPTGIPAINSWKALNDRIWLLCTPDQQAYWRYIIQGLSVPEIAVTEVDWSNYDGVYPYTLDGVRDPFLGGA